MRSLRAFVQALALTSCLAAPKYFGYYGANLTANSQYSNLYQADTIAEALAAHAAGQVSLLGVYGAFFTGAVNATVLLPDWEAQWAALAAEAAPHLQSGVILGFNLGDELVWNCLAPANLTIAADAVRASFPRGSAVVWYNEATPPIEQDFDSCGHTHLGFSIPPSLDWFSTDKYHFNGPVAGWVQAEVQAFYETKIYPRLTAQQLVMLVPGSFGSDVNHFPNGTYVCNRSCYDQMCAQDAADFYSWAQADPRVVAIMPWNWGGCPSCNGSRWTPPHTCCMDELGTDVQPLTIAAWADVGQKIIANSAPHAALREVRSHPAPHDADAPPEPLPSLASATAMRPQYGGGMAQWKA